MNLVVAWEKCNNIIDIMQWSHRIGEEKVKGQISCRLYTTPFGEARITRYMFKKRIDGPVEVPVKCNWCGEIHKVTI